MCPREKSTLSEPVTVYLRTDQRQALDRVCVEESRTLSNLLRRILDAYLSERDEVAA
jgi:hypothetical protein